MKQHRRRYTQEDEHKAFMKDLGRKAMNLRVRANISQKDMAKMVRMSQANYNRFENRGDYINPYSFRLLCDMLDVSADEMLNRTVGKT